MRKRPGLLFGGRAYGLIQTGPLCRSPAVQGRSVCRMHGAGGGAPKGNRNALKHGLYTAKAVEARRAIAALTKQARELVGRV